MTSETPPNELALAFANLHGMLLSEEDATSAVEHLARAVRMVIPAAVGVGVSLLDEQGKRLTRAATDEVVGTADDLQYDLGEGPCLTAWSTQTVQRIDDTRGDPRWPQWARAAAELGVRSAVSVPLAYHGSSLGAMKVYATVPAAFTDQDADVIGLMAEAAATLLGAGQSSDQPGRLSESLRSALESREVIARATGALMVRHRIDATAARVRLLKSARARRRRVVDLAANIVDRQYTGRS